MDSLNTIINLGQNNVRLLPEDNVVPPKKVPSNSQVSSEEESTQHTYNSPSISTPTNQEIPVQTNNTQDDNQSLYQIKKSSASSDTRFLQVSEPSTEYQFPTATNSNITKILSLSLDHKVFATITMLNLAANLIHDFSHTFFYEVMNSPINYQNLINLTEFAIDYKRFSNYDAIESHISRHKYEDDSIILTDLGFSLYNYQNINIEDFETIYVFTSSSPKLQANKLHLDAVNFLKDQKNVILINREEIFTKTFQVENVIILPESKREKHLSKIRSKSKT